MRKLSVDRFTSSECQGGSQETGGDGKTGDTAEGREEGTVAGQSDGTGMGEERKVSLFVVVPH